jgi:hypothetical protein
MAKKADKIIERERAYWKGQLVTVLEKGKRKSTIRTGFGYVTEDVPNKELDFNVEDDKATLRYEPPNAV